MIRALLAFLRGGEAPKEDRPAPTSLERASSPPEIQAEASIERALRIAGVTNQTPEVLSFYEALVVGHASYRDILRAGDALTKQDKATLGIKTRAHVGSAFAATLNERGLSDVGQAAARIAGALNQQRQSAADLHRPPDLLGKVDKLRFWPSAMAAGPCSPAAQLGKRLVDPSTASALPLEGCEHPDQCGCRYLPPSFRT